MCNTSAYLFQIRVSVFKYKKKDEEHATFSHLILIYKQKEKIKDKIINNDIKDFVIFRIPCAMLI